MGKITARRLRALLDYDSHTGRFTWRVGRGRARKGDIAGTLTTKGYRQIKVGQHFYTAGPLAFLWMTGKWPPKIIDHVNMKPDDNRWSNLRKSTHSQNHANGRGKGFTWDRRTKRYQAQIKVNYRSIHLGRFKTAKAARAAYLAAARKYFGEFAQAK